MSEADENSLAEFFVSGIEPHDVSQLFPLLNARSHINALIAMFRGGNEEVLARLMVLREIGLRAEAPEWSPLNRLDRNQPTPLAAFRARRMDV